MPAGCAADGVACVQRLGRLSDRIAQQYDQASGELRAASVSLDSSMQALRAVRVLPAFFLARV
jgi:hypothetical protein